MDDEAFLARYDALLDAAWARGIRTVVDFHQDVYAEVYCGDGFPAWTLPGPLPAPHHDCPNWYNAYLSNPDVQAAFDRFWADGSTVQSDYLSLWQRLAARERDRAGVIGFEPINEPAAGTANEMTFESTTLTAFYSKLVGALNTAAPGALVFVDPPGLSSATHTTQLGKPDGDGIVFAPHYYQPVVLFGGDGVPEQVSGDLAKWMDVGNRWGVPVFLGEYGADHDAPGAADLIAAHHDAFDSLGMSGTEWEYSTATEVWNAERFTVARADGSAYPVTAALLRPHAQAVAGEPTSMSWDAATRHYTLRYTASGASGDGAVSEIVIPPGTFADGYELSVSGACVDDSVAGRLRVRAEAAGTVEVQVTSH
jgi:endoglycosylceramidase